MTSPSDYILQYLEEQALSLADKKYVIKEVLVALESGKEHDYSARKDEVKERKELAGKKKQK